MDIIYYLTGILAVIVLPAIIIATILSLANPKLLNKSKHINNPVSRKRVLLVGAIAFSIAFVSSGSVLAMTEPASVKQARIVAEAATKKTEQEKLTQQNKLVEQQRKIEAVKPKQTTDVKVEPIPFTEETKEDGTLAKGATKVTQEGVNGERTITYEITTVGGKEVNRKETKNEITTQPVSKITTIGTYVAPVVAKPKPASNCDPNYSGACVPIASDVDCAGGSGNGPAYVSGPVYVTGTDIYGLDRDGDGVGCE